MNRNNIHQHDNVFSSERYTSDRVIIAKQAVSQIGQQPVGQLAVLTNPVVKRQTGVAHD